MRAGWTVILAAAAIAALAAAAPAANRGILHAPGDRETTAITPAGDADTFVFDLPTGAALSVTVRAARGTTLLPDLSLVRPDGTEVPAEALAAAKYVPGKPAVRLSKFPLDATGRWAARVRARGAGQTGSYTFQTKVKYPRPVVGRGVTLPAGTGLDIRVPLAGGTRLTFVLRRKSGGTGLSTPSVITPAGPSLPFAASSWTVSDAGISAKALEIATPSLGDHTLRVPGPAVGGDAVVDYSVKVAWPRRKPGSRTLSSLEPTPTAVAPDQGNFGTSLQVSGTNFAEGAFFELGGVRATSIARNLSGTVLTGIAPQGSGTVAVAVVNPDGQENSLPAAFTYIPPPTIASVVPDRGPATGGTAVTITGTNFRAGTKVYFGTTPVLGAVTVVNATTLTLVTEARPSGSYVVEVRDTLGQSAQLVGGFTFERLLSARGGSFPAGILSARADTAVLGDLDGDLLGNDDLVIADDAAPPDGQGGFLPAARVLRGNNDLTFTDLTAASFPGPFFPTIGSVPGTGLNPSLQDLGLAHASAMGDLDGDGDQDLVLSVDGRFTPANGWVLNNPAYPATSAYRFIPSVNLTTQYYYLQYPGTRLLRNDGSFRGTSMAWDSTRGITMPLPVLAQGIVWGEFFQARAVALGDLDGDSDLDLVLATADRFSVIQLVFSSGSYTRNILTSPALRALANDGQGNFRFDPKFVLSGWTVPEAGGECFQAAAVAVADLDGNGLKDIVLVNDAAPTASGAPVFALRILGNTGAALVPAPTSLPAATSLDDGRGTTLALADVNADGRPDILVGTPDALATYDGETGAATRKSSTRVFRNNGGLSFTDVTGTAMPAATASEGWQARALAVGDLDGDGDPDLVLATDGATSDGAGGYLPSTRVLLNNGAGAFAPAPAGFVPAVDLSVPSFLQGRVALLGDLDGDGDRDTILATGNPVQGIPAAGSTAPTVQVLENR